LATGLNAKKLFFQNKLERLSVARLSTSAQYLLVKQGAYPRGECLKGAPCFTCKC